MPTEEECSEKIVLHTMKYLDLKGGDCEAKLPAYDRGLYHNHHNEYMIMKATPGQSQV